MIDQINFLRLQRQCKQASLPSFVCDYLGAYKKRPSKSDPWMEQRIVVFDTETTGLNLQKDRILEIGAVVIQGGEIILEDSFELLVDADKSPMQDSIRVHGLMPEEIRLQGVSELEGVEKFLKYIQADVLMAHHANFDIHMVEMALRRKGMEQFFLYNHRIDTALLAMKVEHPHKPSSHIKKGSYGLDSLCERYDISMEDRHRAWGDALITAKLFLRLSHDFVKNGKTKLRHLTQ